MSNLDEKFLFVVQHCDIRFNLMSFSIAQTWQNDQGLDVALYLMYDAVQLVRKDRLEERPDIKAAVDDLLQRGASIYVCGFCTRTCQISADEYYPGIVVANRRVFHTLMMERRVVYY
jgi:predicted peroxiredoxin